MIDKIKFKDLSNWLKASVIFAWIMAGYYTILFLIALVILIIG